MYKDELMTIVTGWPIEQLNNYIKELEYRVEETQQLLKELRALRRRKTRTKVVDNGTRGGK